MSNYYPPKPKKVAYVVFIGRIIGIHESWAECEASVKGFQGAKFKGYTVYEDAITAWENFEERGVVDVRGSNKKKKRTFHGKPRRVDPAISQRARELVSTGSGSHTTTCTAATCTYPACSCR